MRNDMPISESLLAQVLLPADEIQLRQPAEHAGTQNLLVLTPAQQKAARTLNGALAWSCVAELRSRSVWAERRCCTTCALRRTAHISASAISWMPGWRMPGAVSSAL